jgi:class I fructose-bisphosphate aldolase/fructose-bisphosphate aldolase/2-amino-3,7-dideoxy-D-threo-hept-6-ulosonate synthase
MSGKKLRLNRFRYRGSPNGLIVPLDHGLTVGPLPGIGNVREMRGWITDPHICGVIVHKGMAERLTEAGLLDGKGVMVHLNGMSTLGAAPDTKVELTGVEAALRLGADGVSFQVNFDGTNDAANLATMGRLADEAARFGLPVLAMIYDKVKADETTSVQRLRHHMRAAIELGCDAIKIAPPAAPRLLPLLLAGLAEDIPVFLAGGVLADDDSLFDLARLTVRSGGAGLCVGRNVFQRPDAPAVLAELAGILRPRAVPVTEAFPAGMGYAAH